MLRGKYIALSQLSNLPKKVDKKGEGNKNDMVENINQTTEKTYETKS